MTTALGFTGRGERIVVEVPTVTARKRLTAELRQHAMRLIVAEHRGDEPEINALDRVIAKTEHEKIKMQGVRDNEGRLFSDLISMRLDILYAYRAELAPEEW